jgi:hypothetical protein
MVASPDETPLILAVKKLSRKFVSKMWFADASGVRLIAHSQNPAVG